MQEGCFKEITHRHFKKFPEKFITFDGFKFKHVIFARNLKLNITFKNCNLKNMKFDNIISGEMIETDNGIKYVGGLKFIDCDMGNVFISCWGKIEKKNCKEFMVGVQES